MKQILDVITYEQHQLGKPPVDMEAFLITNEDVSGYATVLSSYDGQTRQIYVRARSVVGRMMFIPASGIPVDFPILFPRKP